VLDWNATALEVSAFFSLAYSPNRSSHDVATEFPASSYAAAFLESLCPEEQDATEKIVNARIKKPLINLMKNACHSPCDGDIFSKMKNVFIDTNIFIGKRFDVFNETDFTALSEYIKSEKIKLFSHKVVVSEIKKHFRSDVSAGFDQYTSFFSKLKLLRGSGFSGFDRPATKDEMIEKGFSLIDAFFI
jgi:rRNA-processing protein FCF1